MSEYIGKTISLISNKGLRYVGFLYNISAEDATVALQSVRSFGTEGRMAEQGQPSLEVKPGTEVYDCVTFRGSDVKDLSVLDIPLDQVQPAVHQAGPTHALAATGAPATATHNQTQAAPQSVPATSTADLSPTRERPSATQSAPKPAPGSRPAPKAQTRAPESVEGDFDFEKANARFQKKGKDKVLVTSVYNKSTSFFDSISLNVYGSMRWSEEKDLNIDTFGEASARRGRGNWRGRGRGRGGWWGRDRGRGGAQAKPEWA
ncbi:hypothetical protein METBISCDRAFT_15288 [Metschnikowia bicuspidata]|uniref:TFG box profile domain-containing protein n=1 Tax=Metschnikowia bicuspidata TaxID=27322 RepID=A0A4P9ZD58_9ASCO|nr:hypothetical protein METBISCDRAFT_15288 [Metschnikowia bicuspidata]